jgi:hypothetical protein
MQKLHKLAEIGIFTLKALYPGEISVSQAPQKLFPPLSLYKVSLTRDEFLYHIIYRTYSFSFNFNLYNLVSVIHDILFFG